MKYSTDTLADVRGFCGHVVVAAAVAVGLSGCGTIPLSGKDETRKSWAEAAIEVAKDPKCGHTDRIDIDIGVVSKGKVFLERTCVQPQPGGPRPITDKMVDDAVARALDARFGPPQP